MFSKLLPTETLFFDFFEQHAKLTLQTAQLFLQFITNDQKAVPQGVHPIKILDHQANEVTYQCIENLYKSFITPLQQDDIFHLISRMNDIIDCIDEVFEDYLIYNISASTPAARELARLLIMTTEKLEMSIQRLRDHKKYAAMIRETNRQIHRLENEAEMVLRKALRQLFEEEHDIRLLMKWKDIYGGLERAMDCCKDVSNILEGIILEYN
jgi:uncharacterized protein Yka (UPF0111/DUF47 family)